MSKEYANKEEVIKLMNEGWQLGRSISFITSTSVKRRTWIQKNGIGSGGEIKNVKPQTVTSLLESNTICIDQDKPGRPTTYKLINS